MRLTTAANIFTVGIGKQTMSDTPERVWVKESHDSWGQYGHWYAHGKGGGTEYVRDNRIEELEAKLSESEALLAKAVGNIENLIIAIAMGWDLEGVVAEARTTLEELEGQDNE